MAISSKINALSLEKAMIVGMHVTAIGLSYCSIAFKSIQESKLLFKAF